MELEITSLYKLHHSSQTIQNSALQEWKFFTQRKCKFPAKEFKTLCSENANLGLKKCNGALNTTPRILRSENGNFALKKWKFCTQKINGKISKSHEKSTFPRFVPAKSGNSALPCSSRNSALNCMIAESRRDWAVTLWADVWYWGKSLAHENKTWKAAWSSDRLKYPFYL